MRLAILVILAASVGCNAHSGPSVAPNCSYLTISPPFASPADMQKEAWTLTIREDGAANIECVNLRGGAEGDVVQRGCILPAGTFVLSVEAPRIRGEAGPADMESKFDTYFVRFGYSDGSSPSNPLAPPAAAARELFERARRKAVQDGTWKPHLEDAWKRSAPFAGADR